MYLTGFCVLSLIIGISATCPENPRDKAIKCGRTFRRFGAIAHRNIDKLRSLCPKVYRALDCLREITNDCEMYQNAGFTMTDNAYLEQKSALDFVCQSGSETNEIQPTDTSGLQMECNSEMIRCGKIGKQMVSVTDPQQMCSILSQLISCYEDLQTSCQSILPPASLTAIADSKSKYQEMCVGGAGGAGGSGGSQVQCVTMLSGCARKINEFGAAGSRMCLVAPEVTSCLNNLEQQCSNVLPVGQLSQMRGNIREFITLCNRGNDQGRIPENPSSVVSEGESLPAVQGDSDGEGAGAASQIECINMLNGCVQTMNGLSVPGDQMCLAVPDVAACFDNLEARCSSFLPAGQVDQMRGSISGIVQLCEATQTKKRNAEATANECNNMMMGCANISSQIAVVSSIDDICPILSQALSCYSVIEQHCSDILPPSASNVVSSSRAQFASMCGSGHSTGMSQIACLRKFNTCVEMMSSLAGPQMCSGLDGVYSCLDDLDTKCSHVLRHGQVSQIRNSLGQLSDMCDGGQVTK